MSSRRIAVILSSALAAGALSWVTAPPAAAAPLCFVGSEGAGASLVNVSGTDYCIRYFNSSTNNWYVPTWVSSLEIVIVGGGGGGARSDSQESQEWSAGGGGAGGEVRQLTGGDAVSITGVTTINVTIGAGGGISSSRSAPSGGNGGSSSVVTDIGTTYTASGGQGGQTTGTAAARSIKGGELTLSTGSTKLGGTGALTGTVTCLGDDLAGAAGGGGAGAAGNGSGATKRASCGSGTYDNESISVSGGTGGLGVDLYSFTGVSSAAGRYFGCGGGGGASADEGSTSTSNTTPPHGYVSAGLGYGGCFSDRNENRGNPLTTIARANSGYGGGGGGGRNSNYSDTPGRAQAGGSGVVIVRYAPLVKSLSVSAGGGVAPSSSAASGVVLGTQPRVQLMDGLNPDAQSGVVVTATAGGDASCALQPSVSVSVTTDDSGVAAFIGLALDATAGVNCTLTFTDTSSGTYAAVTSGNILMSTGPAVGANSVVSVADDSLPVAAPGSTSAVSVQLRDSAGNALGASEYATFGPYSVNLSTSGAAGSVGSVTDDTNGTYSAVFTGGTQTGVVTIGGSLTLDSGAQGVPGALVDDSVLMTPGPPDALEVATQAVAGAGGYSGQALGTQPIVDVVDEFGNTVTDDSSTRVQASLVQVAGSGAFSLSGDDSVAASGGVGAFTNLAITGRATDTYRLDFTASGLTGTSSSDFQVAREPQTVVWVSGSNSTVTYGTAPVAISAYARDVSNAPSGLPVTFSSSNPSVCSVTPSLTPTDDTYYATVVFTGAAGGGGTCTVTANQAGNADFAPAQSSGLVYTVNRANQSGLSITSDDTAVYGTNLSLAGSGGQSTQALTWGSSSGPCTVTGSGPSGVLAPTGVGACVVTLDRLADNDYNSATQVSKSITIIKRDQVVSFTSPVPIQPKSFQTYTATFESSLGASYAPTVAVTTGDGVTCSIDDSTASTATISFLASGPCTLTATNLGDGNTNAGSATQTIEVDRINQNITFPVIADDTFGLPPFPAGASTTSGRPLTFTSSTPTTCTVGSTSGVIQVIDQGTCSITASRAADAQYAAANPVTRTFQVVPALPTLPFISSVSPGDSRITVSFIAPGFTGAPSEVIAGYELTATPTSGPAITQSCSDTTAPLVCTMTGLANGTDYVITVAAVNTSGVGANSAPSSLIRPVTSANAVTNAYAVPGIDGTSVHLYWDRIDNTVATLGGGAFTRYDIYQRQTGAAWPGTAAFTSANIDDSNYNFTGLVNGQPYDFKIVAVTTANASEVTGNTAIVSEFPSTVPGVPTSDELTELGDQAVEITWQVPLTDGGATITEYRVTAAGVTPCVIDPTTDPNACVFTNLALGTTYNFRLVAVNRMGESQAVVLPHTTPTPPAPQPPPPAPPVPLPRSQSRCPRRPNTPRAPTTAIPSP